MDQNRFPLLHTSTLGRRSEPEKKVLQRQNSIYLMLKAFPTVLRIRFFGRGPEKKRKVARKKLLISARSRSSRSPRLHIQCQT